MFGHAHYPMHTRLAENDTVDVKPFSPAPVSTAPLSAMVNTRPAPSTQGTDRYRELSGEQNCLFAHDNLRTWYVDDLYLLYSGRGQHGERGDRGWAVQKILILCPFYDQFTHVVLVMKCIDRALYYDHYCMTSFTISHPFTRGREGKKVASEPYSAWAIVGRSPTFAAKRSSHH